TAPAARGAGGDAFVTEVIRFDSIDAQQAADTLRPLVSRAGQISANRSGNAVVVADYADNVRRIRALADQIDRDRAATRTITLKNAGAREIAATLTQLAGTRDGQSPVNIVPVDSANAVALRGDPAVVSRLADVATELDRKAAAGSDIRVVFLNHADADKVLPVLQQLVGQTPTAPAAGSSGNGNAAAPSAAASAPTGAAVNAIVGRGQAVIARFEGANALVIAAPADVQRQLGEVVRQLDTRREQVLVEAIIVEISDNAAKKLGVQFLLSGTEGSNIPFGVTNYSNTAPNILAIAGAVAADEGVAGDNSDTLDSLRQAAVNSLLSATGGTAGFGGQLGNDAVFGVILNAVKADSQSNLLSTPSVMTLDNQEAKILVGQEIPITTGQSLSNNFDNAFRTVQRQNVGVQLEVKPQINAGGAIKLFLRQEVSSIAGPVSADNSELILNKREIETTVTVDDGQIVALGGLIDENERQTIQKVPLLGDIPGLGELFKSRSRERGKTNLMVFIRPTIVRSPADAQRIAAQRYDYMRSQQTGGDPKKDSTLDALVREYLKAAPPTEGPQVIAPAVRETQQVITPAPSGGAAGDAKPPR
ncbi:MAG: type II secretion system secretin GspD, partial [Alphaproteobacteria bacterium]|nr:type II secretion system secretin GspD [Alphaproteobacteria bacterium]